MAKEPKQSLNEKIVVLAEIALDISPQAHDIAKLIEKERYDRLTVEEPLRRALNMHMGAMALLEASRVLLAKLSLEEQRAGHERKLRALVAAAD